MLPWDLFTMSKLEFYGKVNFLKGAITLSDYITSVSRRYSQEIQTAEFGFGLEGVLRARSGTVTGIMNGVDYAEWSPESDRFIAAQYSAQDLSGKAAVQARPAEGVRPGRRHAVANRGHDSRFVDQKGFDLIHQIGGRLAQEELIMVVLGTGEREYEDMFRRLNKQYPQKFAVKIAYDDALAHKVEAGSDMFLMPSHYEPCGMNQIYSLRYGTVPVVRAVGGLDDTVENFDPKTLKGTGFKFKLYSGEALLETLKWATAVYRQPRCLAALMRNAMAQDYSWPNSAREYVKVYERARQMKAALGG